MSGRPPSRSVGGRPGDDPASRSRWRRFVLGAGGAVLLTIAALAAPALIFDSNAGGDGGSARARVAARENDVGANGQFISDLTPLAPSQFDRPVAEYKAYAGRWAGKLGRDVRPLTAALRDGNRAAAQRDWMTAFADYLHLGAVYGLLPAGLNNQLAQVPSAMSDDDFPGLHRIEMGLWTGRSPRSLVPVAEKLSRAVAELRRTLPSVRISPLDYATRTHEILEDAQRDLMSGTTVPWSGEGVLGTAAGLAVTEKMVSTLVPLLDGRDDTLAVTHYWLARLQKVLAAVRRRDGTYPRLSQLSQAQAERIDATLAGTLSALSEVPGSLETTRIRPIPTIPAGTR